jgi:hypothetical protein
VAAVQHDEAPAVAVCVGVGRCRLCPGRAQALPRAPGGAILGRRIAGWLRLPSARLLRLLLEPLGPQRHPGGKCQCGAQHGEEEGGQLYDQRCGSQPERHFDRGKACRCSYCRSRANYCGSDSSSLCNGVGPICKQGGSFSCGCSLGVLSVHFVAQLLIPRSVRNQACMGPHTKALMLSICQPELGSGA